MMTIEPTPRQREIEQSFVCKAPTKRKKHHYMNAKEVKAVLLEKKMNIIKLGERIGVAKNQMYNIMQNVNYIKPEKLDRVCKVLGMSRKSVATLR